MTDAAAQAGQDRNRARPIAARHDSAERDEGLAQQEGRAVRLPRMVKPHGSAGRLARAARRQRVVDDAEASRPASLALDDAAQRGNQAEQPEAASRQHPMVGLPASRGANARTARVTGPPWASMAPTISSARVLRAGPGMDNTISWTHLDSVAGKAVSGCGSMAPSGVWSDTRNMGPAARRHRLEPARHLRAGSD